jgi:hypothetical protein
MNRLKELGSEELYLGKAIVLRRVKKHWDDEEPQLEKKKINKPRKKETNETKETKETDQEKINRLEKEKKLVEDSDAQNARDLFSGFSV